MINSHVNTAVAPTPAQRNMIFRHECPSAGRKIEWVVVNMIMPPIAGPVAYMPMASPRDEPLKDAATTVGAPAEIRGPPKPNSITAINSSPKLSAIPLAKTDDEINMPPIERWMSTSHKVRLLNIGTEDEIFQFEDTRRVKKDGTFSLNGKTYET